MAKKMDRIREIFIKIKEGHPLWKKGDDAYKKRLEKAFEPFFIELEQLGVDRHFTEALLFFGAEFLDSFNRKKTTGSAQVKLDGTEDSVHDTPVERGLSDEPATIKDAEKIFGAEAVEMSDREIREAKLAEKSGALTWRSMPMKGDQVGIKILTYKEKQN